MTVEERLPEPTNPSASTASSSFIEYTTSQPQAFGTLLQKLGFAPSRAIARAR